MASIVKRVQARTRKIVAQRTKSSLKDTRSELGKKRGFKANLGRTFASRLVRGSLGRKIRKTKSER